MLIENLQWNSIDIYQLLMLKDVQARLTPISTCRALLCFVFSVFQYK